MLILEYHANRLFPNFLGIVLFAFLLLTQINPGRFRKGLYSYSPDILDLMVGDIVRVLQIKPVLLGGSEIGS